MSNDVRPHQHIAPRHGRKTVFANVVFEVGDPPSAIVIGGIRYVRSDAGERDVEKSDKRPDKY